MIFGIHEYILTDHWADDRLDLLDTARELGVECFEIAVGDDVAFTPARTRERAEALGMRLVVSPGARWPAECDLASPDPAHRQRGVAWHRRQLALGAELGAVAYTGAIYGHTGTVALHPPTTDELAWMAEGLLNLAEFGAGLGLEVVIEPMSHFRTHLVNTPAQALAVLAAAGHPNLRVLFDTYHAVTEVRDFPAAIRSLRGKLWGLHACENDRGAPGGGLLPWPAMFEALRDTGFDGYVLLEAYNSGIPGFAHGRRMFHDVCPDGPEFVRRGLTYLRGLANA